MSMVYFILKFIVNSVRHGAQALIPLAAVLFTSGDKRWLILVLVIIVTPILLISGSILSYLKFRFKISKDTFQIKSGVIKVKSLTLNFERIQNVTFSEPLYFRPFGLVIMSLESAGSSSEEVSLGGIPRRHAEKIRTQILNYKNRVVTSTVNEVDDAPPPDKDEIIHQPIGELVRYGLMNNSIWIFAGAASGFLAQIEWDDYEVYSFAKEAIMGFMGTSQLSIILYTIASILFLIAVLLSLSIIGTIIINYDYHLSKDKERFHRTKGLFERQETSLLESKIQSLIILQPWIAKLLDRLNIQLTQAGSSENANQIEPSTAPKFLIPSVKENFSQQFTSLLYPNFKLAELALKPIHKLYTKKIILWFFLPLSLFPSLAIALAFKSAFALLPLLLPVLALPLVMLRRSKYAYAMNDEYGVMRSGFIGDKHIIFPLHKVQTVHIVRSPGQRKAGLANLHIKLAGVSLQIPYIPMKDAMHWRDTILHKVETSNKPWM